MKPVSEADDLLPDLLRCRRAFESVYPNSDGHCWVAALFLAEVIPDAVAVFGWMFDTEGKDRKHAFAVVGAGDQGEIVLDITADQFGWNPVVATDGRDARYAVKYEIDLADHGVYRTEVRRLVRRFNKE